MYCIDEYHVIMIHWQIQIMRSCEDCVYAEEGYDCDGNAVCNYSSVDFVGNESINEYEGVLYFNLESYSQAGISTDGYTANIIVNGDSIPLNHDGLYYL